MDTNKWSNVLVEWINCLKLSKTIQNVDDLRNEEFFTNLQKVIKKSSDCQDNLTFIFDLFTRHYPKYSVENKSEIHINDVSIVDLNAITSLLMHYTCVFDRKDVLTSPLCHSLSQSTQLIIRKFLEKLTSDVTRENLDNIIVECITNLPKNAANGWLSIGSSDDCESPLQDLLRTPVSKFGRLHEKDRIINKLKAELEVERYERADLQQELKLQIDKNRKIEKQLGKKSTEISKLRGEVVALENRTPPHYQDIDSRDLQRRLRSEIQSLERYVQQIEGEQEEIKKEKDAVKEKLRCFESQCTIWQEKFFETERNFESLSEHSKQTDSELESLKAHCNELTALLDEYKTRTPNEASSFFDSYVDAAQNQTFETPDYEDLACSVVEVQLRDALKLNEELKEKIDAFENDSVDLKDQIEEYAEALRKNEKLLEIKRKQFDGLRTQHEMVVEILVSFKKDLVAVRRDHENAKSCLGELQVASKELVAQFSLKLRQGEENCRRITQEKSLLADKVEALESKCADYEEQLFATKSNLVSVENISKQQEAQINDLELSYAKLESCHESTQNKLQIVCEEKENGKKRLDEALNSIEDLKRYLDESVKNGEILMKERDELLLKVEILDVAREACQKDLNTTQASLADATLNLETSLNKCSMLEKSYEFLANLYTETEALNELVRQDLQTLSAQKESDDAMYKQLSEENERLTLELENLEAGFETIQAELTETDWVVTDAEARNLEKEAKALEQSEQLCSESTQQKTVVEETLKRTEQTNEGLGVQITDATNENATMSANYDKLSAKLATTLNSFASMKKECKLMRKHDASLRLELRTLECDYGVVQEEIGMLKENFNKQLEDKELALHLMQVGCEELDKSLDAVTKDLAVSTEANERLHSQLKLVTEENENLKVTCEELRLTLTTSSDNLSATKTEFELLKSNYDELEARLGEELRVLTANFGEKELECNKLRSGQEQLVEQLQVSETNRIKAEASFCQEKIASSDLSDRLAAKEAELEETKTANINMVASRELAKEDLVNHLEGLTTERDAAKLEVDEFKSKLIEESERFTARLEEKQQEFSLLQDEKTQLLVELDASESKLLEVQGTLTVLEREYTKTSDQLELKDYELEALRLALNSSRFVHQRSKKALEDRLEEVTRDFDASRLAQEEAKIKFDEDLRAIVGTMDEKKKESVLLQNDKTKLLSELVSLQNGHDEALEKLSVAEARLGLVTQQLKQKQLELENVELSRDNLRNSLEAIGKEFKCRLETFVVQLKNIKLAMQEFETKTVSDFGNLKTYLQKLAVECKLLLDDNKELREKLQASGGKSEKDQLVLEHLEQTLSAVSKKLDDKERELNDLKSNNGNLKSHQEQQQIEFEAKVASLTRLTDEQKLEIDNLQSRSGETEMKLQSAENKIDSLQSQLQKSEAFLSSFRDEMGAITIKYDETCEKCGVLAKEKSELEEKVELLATAMQEKLAEVGSQLKSEVDRSRGLECEIEGLKSNCLDIQKASEKAYDLVRGEKEELGNKVQSLESQMATANEQNCELQEEVDKLESEKEQLLKKIETYELEASTMQETLKSLQDTILDYGIAISGLKKVIDTDLEIHMSLKNDRSILQCETEAMRNEIVEIKNKEEKFLSTIIDLLKENNISFTEELTDLESHVFDSVRQLMDDKKRAEEVVTELEGQIENNVKKSEKLTEMLEKLQVLVFGTADSFQDLETCVTNIYEKIDDALRVKDKLDEDSKRLAAEKLELIEKLKKANDEIEKFSKLQSENTEKILKKDGVNNRILKLQKENVATSDKSDENEWKKKSMVFKQKLLLTESAKNKLEEKIKQLREENKKLSEASSSLTSDVHYKMLLQEHIQLKEELAKLKETPTVKVEEEKKMSQDLKNIRDAYTSVMSANSKLELDNVTLRKLIEERNAQVSDLYLVRDAYEKLLEENNKVITEIDTIRYKRLRDKDEYLRLLKKEREDGHAREGKRVQEVRIEYEGKLEKMKEKMLKLYRDEVNKEVQKMKAGQSENHSMTKTICDLRSELFEAGQKLQLLEMERDMLRTKIDTETKFYLHDSGRNSISSAFSRDSMVPRVSTITTRSVRQEDPRRASTLPRSLVEEQITISRRTSTNPTPSSIGHSMHMEDEDDDFNNKYLADLKEGRCALPGTGRESTADRVSELAWRNSLLPPHLKSSYPAEVQFVSPNHFKEDDIKTGHIEFETSMSRLLPGDKPRKKDFGTTSYKKPGPPTPIKNGGRLSLQGNEVHPLREIESKTPKKSTPSRIRALFAGRNNSSKEHSDVQSGTPARNRRLHIFRRPK